MNFDKIPSVRENYDQPNYDRSKIGPYTLEDPLVFLSGEKAANPNDWKRRRKEILSILASEMYGQEPPRPDFTGVELIDEKTDALAGFAVRSQYKMYFRKDKSGPCVNWLVIRPRHADKPVPVILFLNYNGNHEMLPDTDIPVPDCWLRNNGFTVNHHQTENTRGRLCDPNSDTVFPIGIILARGYAVATACYGEISPDPDGDEPEERFNQKNFAYTGMFSLWGKRDESRDDNITALGAWAWTLSRGLDLVERIPELDAKKAIVTGCSRLGKSAILAAARDERFAVCVANQCGGGGVCLAKRDFGENIGTEARMFTHWFCKAYAKYQRNPAKMLSFDQHFLVAAIAPRPLLVQGFTPSDWMDPEGEYLACQAASHVWDFLGLKGMPCHGYPKPFSTSEIGPYLGYVLRDEKHGISACDWQWMMDFADKHVK